jgi:hypothetical protein
MLGEWAIRPASPIPFRPRRSIAPPANPRSLIARLRSLTLISDFWTLISDFWTLISDHRTLITDL